jgi:hypothetical protein
MSLSKADERWLACLDRAIAMVRVPGQSMQITEDAVIALAERLYQANARPAL